MCLVVLGRMGVCLAGHAVHRALEVMGSSRVALGVLREHHVWVVMLQSGLRRSNLRVVGVGLDMLLQILGSLEGLATEIAFVRLQGDMHSDMRCDMVTLDRCGVASAPLASQVQVVGALAANMTLTDVFLFVGGQRLVPGCDHHDDHFHCHRQGDR